MEQLRIRAHRQITESLYANHCVDDATEKLTHAVEEMHADDLREVYNELFPDEPATEEEAYEDVAPLVEQIVGRIAEGLAPEEVVDLWNVVFPKDRDVYFNEEDNLLHFAAGKTAS